MRKINYPEMYRWVCSRPRAVAAMRHIHTLSVVFVAVAFVTHVALTAIFVSVWHALTLLAVSGAPFLLVSLARRLIGRERPYEVYDFGELGIEPPRRKCGDSFPSRHTFSAFLIGTLILFDVPLLGAAVLVFGVYLAASRVLLGYHFLSDVVSGSVIGAVTGVTGAVCMMIF